MQDILKSDTSYRFNTNILKIALNLREDKVAAIMLAQYPISLDQGIVEYSISCKCLTFIQ
jgi:hypothetical protein